MPVQRSVWSILYVCNVCSWVHVCFIMQDLYVLATASEQPCQV